ncbi:MAG: SIS domain-containing protein [Clostridiales bacterium]|nr:SIS domain-containing protein [Clostridiales bacterium]
MNFLEERKKLAAHQAEMLTSVDQAEIDALADAMVAAKRIFVSGWGRAGNNIKVLAMDCSQIGLRAYIVGDNTCPSMQEGDIFIIGSGSGETKSMVLFANQAKSHGVKIGLLVGKRGSTLESLADYTVHIDDTVMIGSGYKPDAELTELSALVQTSAFYPVMQTVGDVIRACCAVRIGADRQTIAKNHSNVE